jgi:hypothetical protein
MNSRRDVLVATIMEALKERKIVVDEASSRLKDGIIITQPFVFFERTGDHAKRVESLRYTHICRHGMVHVASTL